MRAALIISAAFALAAFPAFAQQRSATVKSGQEVKLGEHLRIGRDCGPPAGSGEFTLVKHPANGAVTTRQSNSELKGATGQNEKCNGKSYPAIQVFYKSKDGWKGADTFSYRIGPASARPAEQTVNITVN